MKNKFFTEKRWLSFLMMSLLVFSLMTLSACKKDDISDTQPSTLVLTDGATYSTTAADEDDAVQTTSTDAVSPERSVELKSEYKPSYGFDDDGNRLEPHFIYGTGYLTYGGSLCFNSDGTFTSFVGVVGNADNDSGNYKVLSDTEIQMNFNNGETVIAKILNTHNGVATEIQMYHRGFDVVFKG